MKFEVRTFFCTRFVDRHSFCHATFIDHEMSFPIRFEGELLSVVLNPRDPMMPIDKMIKRYVKKPKKK